MEWKLAHVMQRPFVDLITQEGLDIRCLTQIIVGLVPARFQYALPAIAGQISVDDLKSMLCLQ